MTLRDARCICQIGFLEIPELALLGWEIKDSEFPEPEGVTTMAGTAGREGKDGAR